jgi:hypothetical protein
VLKKLLVSLISASLLAGSLTAAHAATDVTNGEVYASIDSDRIVLGNSVIERVWSTDPFSTTSMVDKRTGLVTGPTSDFAIRYIAGPIGTFGTPIAGQENFSTEDFDLVSATATPLQDGGVELRVVLEEANAALGRVTRTITAYPGIAGFQTRMETTIPGAISGYVLDRVTLGNAAPEIQAFAAGYYWRGSDPDGVAWEPMFAPTGGAHTGDHRESTTGPAGEDLEGEGEWMSLAATGGRAFLVTERVDYASTHMAYVGGIGSAEVDLWRDLIYLGPFEGGDQGIHVGNQDARAPARYRFVQPGRTLRFEPVFTGLAVDADDEPWQHYRYLTEHRMPDWKRDVTFNSNGVDAGRISTGAKDDMDLAEVERQAAIAKELGVETFILDDGWQAASGDWCPDSPGCPEPRGLYPDRFPDGTFAAVHDRLGDMKLGLWMNPMQFNPAADAYKRNPQWGCEPINEPLVAYNRAAPDDGSNEAGLGTWNPEATGPEGKLIDYIEGRIRNAIDNWGVTYFKFDFLAWVDCVGVEPVTAYDYRESFIRMLDRLIADHPDVTFQIDETNDYRLFPFESVSRGPSWYANGSPKSNEALHNLWLLNPYVPGFTLGQTTLGDERGRLSSDYLMAVALGSHMTFFTDLTRLTEQQIADARRWTDLYKTYRDRFAAFTYPLLEDPLPEDNWTALQPWNPDTQTGALLAFRQDTDESTKTIALRGIRGGGSYVLRDAMTGEYVAGYTADQLRAGIEISLPDRHSAKVLLIDPAQ